MLDPPAGQSHLALIHRGLQRVGARRIERLRRHLDRAVNGAPHLIALREGVAEEQADASAAFSRLDAVARSTGGADDELVRGRAQARFDRALESRAHIDGVIARQQATDARRALRIMEEMRAEWIATRPQAEAEGAMAKISVGPSADEHRDIILSACTDFVRLVEVPPGVQKIRFVAAAGRARTTPDHTIGVFEPDAAQVFHELAHVVEMTTPALYRAAVDWRRARALQSRGEVRSTPLRTIDPDGAYLASERAVEDDFFDPYVGAEYEAEGVATTEVVATGLQHFGSPAEMLTLYASDLEHFMLIAGALAS